MTRSFLLLSVAALAMLLPGEIARAADKPDDAAIVAVRKSGEQIVAAFNAGKVDELAAMFLPKGELIDEEGTVYQGTNEIKDLLGAFFKQYAGAKLSLNVESIRVIGPLAIDEGTRTMSMADGVAKSQFRYIAIWTKAEKGWQLASFRDFTDEPAATPHESLEPLSWLVGDWINEGADGKVAISYRWSEDKNFLLGEFQVDSADESPRKSSQRVGWDPSVGKIRSWLFDSDGGFSEATWTVVDDGIVIKSSSVNPDGTTASATLIVTNNDKDHYSIDGTDRIVGDVLEDDFEITVARRPPAANK